MTKYCTNCGKEIEQEAVVCPHCGRAVENNVVSNPEMKYCTKCGKAIAMNETTCPHCGSISTINNKGVVRVVEDKNSFGIGFLGFIIPLVGLILYLSWRKETPLKAKSAGIGALIGLCVSVVGYIIVGSIYIPYLIELMEESAMAIGTLALPIL